MSASATVLANDARGVARDNVMLLNIGLSVAGMTAIAVVGLVKAGTSWAAWFPFLAILSLLTNPPGYGFLFGLLMVDERDTGMRSALAVSPFPQTHMLLLRGATSFLLMVVWPLAAVLVMNATWRALDLPLAQLLGLTAMLALGAPLTAFAVAAWAANKVEALAIFKGINFASLAPLALYFIPHDTPWRAVFLALPPGWAVFAFDAFRQGDAAAGWRFVLGGAVFLAALLAVSLRAYLASLYKTEG